MPEALRISSPHGDVVPRLKPLLALASEEWGERITQRKVAQATGINYKTVSEWFNHHTKQIDLDLLGRFCWYFDTAQVLAYVRSAGEVPPFPHGPLGRTGPPAAPYPHRMLIRNVIPEKIAGAKVSEIMQATGLTRNTIVALKHPQRALSRIRRTTLAALCAYLSQQEERPVEAWELLVYDRGNDT